jgi:hypothetical protein
MLRRCCGRGLPRPRAPALVEAGAPSQPPPPAHPAASARAACAAAPRASVQHRRSAPCAARAHVCSAKCSSVSTSAPSCTAAPTKAEAVRTQSRVSFTTFSLASRYSARCVAVHAVPRASDARSDASSSVTEPASCAASLCARQRRSMRRVSALSHAPQPHCAARGAAAAHRCISASSTALTGGGACAPCCAPAAALSLAACAPLPGGAAAPRCAAEAWVRGCVRLSRLPSWSAAASAETLPEELRRARGSSDGSPALPLSPSSGGLARRMRTHVSAQHATGARGAVRPRST